MALSDRARDFWDRISPRERAMVVVLSVAVPLGLALWLGFSIRDGLVSMEKRNDQTREALDIVEKFKLNGNVVDEPQIKIPDVPIPLETYVSKAADKGGLKLKGSIETRTAKKNGFVTTTVAVALDDVSTDQLRMFLQEIEQGEKVVAVTHLDVKRDWRDKKKLDATLEISTYSNVEKAKTEGEGSGDKPESDDKDKKGG
jgi:hypothetical protein